MKHIRSASEIRAAGKVPKVIEEYFGRVNSDTAELSIARMISPPGWEEPGQRPDFDEYTVVLRGSLRAQSNGSTIDVGAGEAVHVEAGEWVKYSTPFPEGAEYIAVCIPAFSQETVNRERQVDGSKSCP